MPPLRLLEVALLAAAVDADFDETFPAPAPPFAPFPSARSAALSIILALALPPLHHVPLSLLRLAAIGVGKGGSGCCA